MKKAQLEGIRTIFIPIQNRQQARNVLRTDIFKILNADLQIRLILFVPSFKLDQYREEFQGENLIFEGFEEIPTFFSRLDAFFGRLALFYVDSKTARFMRKKWLFYERKQPLRYFVSITILTIFGNSKFLRSIARFLDYNLVHDDRFIYFFDQYQPDVVYLPNIISKVERSVLRSARKRGVRSIGVINAWDNITLAKYAFRFLPDILVVHNEILKKEAIRHLGMSEEQIFVSGLPHFDHYAGRKRNSREEFCKRLNINPKKRILLFGSVALVNDTEWQVLYLLDQAIQKGALPSDLAIVMRHHPVKEMIRGDVSYSNNVIFDDSKTVFESERRYTEIMTDDMDHLANSLFHSDIIISTCSTLSIDGSAFDTPIIDIAFDGWEERPFYESVKWYYTPYRAYYMPIVESGGTRIVRDFDELVLAIKCYLENPKLDSEGRKRIVKEQCYKLDGKSGERIAHLIEEHLSIRR